MFFKMMRDKKGFTLIEMVITLVILSILMTITLGMVNSSGRIFTASYQRDTDKGIGDNAFEAIQTACRYATHLKITDLNTTTPSSSGSYDQGFYISQTQSDTSSGYLHYIDKTKNDTGYYDQGYYSGRTIRYNIEEVGEGHNHVKLTLQVIRDGHSVYQRQEVIECINISLLTGTSNSNELKDDSTTAYNQYISFSADEQLLTTDSNGYQLMDQAKKLMNAYNAIQNAYVAELSAAETVFENTKDATTGETVSSLSDGGEMSNSVYAQAEAERTRAFIAAKTKYQKQIEDLLGFIPTGSGLSTALSFTDNDSDYKNLMGGVVATSSELFYALLLQNYDKDNDGTISESEFPHFSDPDSFFANTIFSYSSGGINVAEDLVQCAEFFENYTNYAGLSSLKKSYTGTFYGAGTTKQYMTLGSGSNQINEYRAEYWYLKNVSGKSLSIRQSYFPQSGYTYLGSVDDSVSTGYDLNTGYVSSITRTRTGTSTETMYNITITTNNTLPAGNYYLFTGYDYYWQWNIGTWWGTYLTYAGFNISNTLPAGSTISFEIADGNGDDMGYQIGTSSDSPHACASEPYYSFYSFDGSQSTNTVRLYSFTAHQITDIVSYGVEYSAWYGTSSKGLINSLMNWISGNNTPITLNKTAAANGYGYGRTKQTTVNSLTYNIHSYNYALLVYYDKRSTWYYQPSHSTNLSAWINGSRVLSSVTAPQTYDCSVGSTTVAYDIRHDVVSASLLGLNTTGDTVWTPLPVG